MKRICVLIISLTLPLSVGFFGSLFTRISIEDWYQSINKPVFNPPDWIFAPVWTMLYVLMGLAFYLLWIKGSGGNRSWAMRLYLLHLVFNFLWTVLFFGLKSPFSAFIDILVLWVLIFYLIILYYRIQKTAFFLMLPYFLWVSFAVLLNLSILILN